MGQDTGQIRQDIEETRGRMGETVEALGYKTDVPTRARDAVSGRVDSVKSKISGATPDGGDVKQGARRAKGVAQENPLGLAIGAAAVAAERAWRVLRRPGPPPLTRFAVWAASKECTIDISRAREELGYRPVRTREDGLAELQIG